MKNIFTYQKNNVLTMSDKLGIATEKRKLKKNKQMGILDFKSTIA